MKLKYLGHIDAAELQNSDHSVSHQPDSLNLSKQRADLFEKGLNGYDSRFEAGQVGLVFQGGKPL